MLERRPHAEHLGVGLGVDQAGEAVARRAADAVAVRHVRLGQPHAARRVERVVARRLEVVRELLDPRLVRERRERVRRARRRLGRVLAARAVHLVAAARRACSTARARRTRSATPARCRRDAGARRSPPCAGGRARLRRASSPRRRSSGSAAGTVLPLVVVPGVLGHVAVVDEDVVRGPVRRLAREPVAALQQEDPLPRGGEVTGERAAAGARPDDDHVVAIHQYSSSMLGTMIRAAASISARCENACGKLPRWRPVSASNSSA